MNRKQSQKIHTKELVLGSQKITLYSIDEVTWSSNPEEPLNILTRQEEGRLQLQVKVQSVPKEKTPAAAAPPRANLLGGNPEGDEPEEDELEEDELGEDDLDDIELNDELDEEEDESPVVKDKLKPIISPKEGELFVAIKPEKKAQKIVTEVKEAMVTKTGKGPLSKILALKQEKKAEVSAKGQVKGQEQEKKVIPITPPPAVQEPKAKAAKGKVALSKPVKKSAAPSKKIEAPQKGKTAMVKVSPSKGKLPKKG